jgi:hypothetical protein
MKWLTQIDRNSERFWIGAFRIFDFEKNKNKCAWDQKTVKEPEGLKLVMNNQNTT